MDILNLILIVSLQGLLFGLASYFIGKTSEIGALKGAVLGLLFSFVGLIIVLCSREKALITCKDQLKVYERLFENGCITETEFNQLKGRLLIRNTSELI